MSGTRRTALVSALESFPLAVVLLDADAASTVVNGGWVALSGVDRVDSLGAGWLDAVEPVDRRVLVERLRAAAAQRDAGSAEYRLTGPMGRRWTRWWWHPAGGGSLLVCVADVDDDRAREEHLWERATHDPLTGLVNRTQLIDLTERALQHRDRASSPAAIIYADLDGFKAINDTGGHRAGDSVLRTAAEKMSAAIRPDDVLGRVGGDEFAVLCTAIHSEDEAEAVAGRLRASIDLTVDVNGEQFTVTATTGIAVARAGDTAETLLARADEAMYARKSPSVRHSPTAPAVDERLAVADIDVTMQEAQRALAHLERLLEGTWSAVAASPRVERAVKDRLVQASRLAGAAARALDPRSVS